MSEIQEPTAAEKLELIQRAIANARVKPQFILISKATFDQLAAVGAFQPIYTFGEEPLDEESPVAFKIGANGPVVVIDDRVASFFLLAEVPQKQATFADLPEEAIIQPNPRLKLI